MFGEDFFMREEYLAEEMNERDDLFEDIPDDEL